MAHLREIAPSTTMPSTYGNRVAYLLVAASLIVAAPAPAKAATLTEQRILGAPMPHQKLDASGEAVKAHFVHLQGYIEGQPDNAARLAQLQRDVQQCVTERNRDGAPAHPPTIWPASILGIREDRYETVNRSIHYVQTYGYAMNAADCSLIERTTSTADLASNLGACHIDLLKKTARGVCDVAAHTNAPVQRHMPSLRIDAGEVDFQRAKAIDAVQRSRAPLPAANGGRKTILDLECQILSNLPSPGGAACLAFGGSFVDWRHANNPAAGGLLMEVDSPTGRRMRAVEASLDARVNAKIFAPYLDAGFTVTNSQLAK